MRVLIADPSAYTPPYDRALCGALARRPGLEVELVTSPFRHGEVPPAQGFAVRELFYRRTVPAGVPEPVRLAAKLAQHPAGMVRLARAARRADVVHLQWLTVQHVDRHLLPRRHPRLLTAHDVLPREPRPGQLEAQRRLYGAVDHVVVHSEHGAARLREEVGLAADRVTVIPHGAFTHLRDVAPALPPELPADGPPVVLFYGLLRAYKGLDVLLEAWRGLHADAELWVVGAPRMPLPADLGPRVRLVPRFVTEAESAAVLRRAALVVLPYREIDQSGVLFDALGLGKALVLSDAGGFSEVEAAAHVPVGDVDALRATLEELLADPAQRTDLERRATEAAATTYAWSDVAARHEALYRRLGA